MASCFSREEKTDRFLLNFIHLKITRETSYFGSSFSIMKEDCLSSISSIKFGNAYANLHDQLELSSFEVSNNSLSKLRLKE